jgi:ATP-dependent Lon protease
LKHGASPKKAVFPSFLSSLKRLEGGVFLENGKITREEFTLLPLRDLVLFPHTVVPVFITVQPGIAALEEALRRDNRLFTACLKKRDASADAAHKNTAYTADEVWPAGTVVRILQHLRLPDNTFRVVLQGEYRGKILDSEDRDGYAMVQVVPINSGFFGNPPVPEEIALMRAVQRSFTQYAELSKKIGSETLVAVERTENPERMANLICNAMQLKPEKKVELLAISGARERLLTVLEILERENEIFGIQKNISGKVKSRMEKRQREYYLHEQLREINKELGKDKTEDEFGDLEKQIDGKTPPAEVIAKAGKEIARLRKLQPLSPEAGVLRGYLEWIADLPWSDFTADSGDLDEAQRILDEDHFNMRKAKDRIVEFIAVRQLLSDPRAEAGGAVKGPILCFVGPPGTGKTSLGKSVARALGRRFVRISLGGLRDEAEIRGHRKTYVGALPGKIIQSMRKAGTMNPVILLDEIDKLSSDFRGDPASALLEVLDPEQNYTFTDHYMEVAYDLSRVLFITTANSLHGIPYPLLDRMEIIDIPGYGENEKLSIAKQFLVPKALTENGLARARINFTDDALRGIIRYWTMESGVRGLEREIAHCIRRIARQAVAAGYGAFPLSAPALEGGPSPETEHPSEGAPSPEDELHEDEISENPSSSVVPFSSPEAPSSLEDAITVKPITEYKKTGKAEGLEKLLGRRKYKNDVIFKEARVGITCGLAWTETGGAILPVESTRFEGSGELILTGNLGDVMKESARAALSYLRSVQENYRFVVHDIGKTNFHIHVPEGAIPKDGPSAGIAIASSLLSTLCTKPPRPGIAMTGELTLTGRVLPIGGLKEKLLAAIRNGLEKVLLPADNLSEWNELDKDIRDAITVEFVETAAEAFALLFDKNILRKPEKPKPRKVVRR